MSIYTCILQYFRLPGISGNFRDLRYGFPGFLGQDQKTSGIFSGRLRMVCESSHRRICPAAGQPPEGLPLPPAQPESVEQPCLVFALAFSCGGLLATKKRSLLDRCALPPWGRTRPLLPCKPWVTKKTMLLYHPWVRKLPLPPSPRTWIRKSTHMFTP